MTAFAGGINAAESAILGAASGTFEYEGRTYVVAQPYLGMLAAKLSEDGIDLTDTQASALISQAYGMIGDGVAGGYLVPIDRGESSETEESETAETETEQTESAEEETEPETYEQEEEQQTELVSAETAGDPQKEDGAQGLSSLGLRMAIWKGMQVFLQPFWEKAVQFVLGILK